MKTSSHSEPQQNNNNPLKISEENLLLKNALNTVRMGVVIRDREGKVIFYNDALSSYTHFLFQQKESEWDNLLDMRTSEGAAVTVENIPSTITLQTGKPVTQDMTVTVKATGEHHYLNVSSFPFFDEAKNVLAVMVIYQDITQQKNQESELKSALQDKNILFTAMESTSDIVVIVDFHGVPLYVNKAAKNTFGMSGMASEDFKNIHIKNVHTPDSWQKVITQLVPEALEKGSSTGELKLVKPSGKVMEVSQSFICKKNEEGRVEFFASISRDITELNAKKNELVNQQEYFRSIINANPNFIFVKDEYGKYLFVNQRFIDVTGLSYEKVIGKSDIELMGENSRSKKHLKEDLEIISEKLKQHVKEEKFFDKRMKETRWFHTLKKSIKDSEGKHKQILGVGSDITEQKTAEENLKIQLRFSELISRITVDFFNISYSEIDEVMVDSLKTICANTHMTRAMIGIFEDGGSLKYRHVWSHDPNDKFMQGDYPLDQYIPEDFSWTLEQIEKYGYALASGVSDTPEESLERNMLKQLGIRSYLVCPLQQKNHRIGYLLMTSLSRTKLPPSEVTFIKTISQILSTAIERANTERIQEIKLKLEEAITSISSRFINIESKVVDDEISYSIQTICNIIGSDRGYIFSLDENKNELNLSHHWIEESGRPIMEHFLGGISFKDFSWAIETIQKEGFLGIPCLDEIPEHAEKMKHAMEEGGAKSLFAVPIITHGHFVGLFVMASFQKEYFWPEEAIPLFKILAQVIANALDRKANDEKLLESEKLYRAIASNIPKIGVIVFDKNLVIKVVEGKNFKDYDIDTSLMEGKSFSELEGTNFFPYEDHEFKEYEDYYKRVLNGEEITVEKRYHHFYYKIYISPIRNSKNEITSGLLIAFDITDFKTIQTKLESQAFELQRSNEDLEQFAYAASHDLQEPLRMVSSYVHLIDRKIGNSLNPDVKEFMAFAIDGVKRMQELINDLLEYSRVERKGRKFANVDLNNVLHAVKFNLQHSILEHDAQIIYENLPVVKADYSQITSLFQNLIENGIKFRSKDKPIIKIEFSESDKFFTFSVRDNGVGIEEKFFDRIFVIFQRLNERTKYPGTGIGLSICKKIVERHGGKIWLESEPGRGTAFYFELKK